MFEEEISVDIIIGKIHSTDNLEARFVLLLFLRLSKDFKENLDLMFAQMTNYKKIKVVNENNDVYLEYFDVLIDDLMEKKYFYGVYLWEYRY